MQFPDTESSEAVRIVLIVVRGVCTGEDLSLFELIDKAVKECPKAPVIERRIYWGRLASSLLMEIQLLSIPIDLAAPQSVRCVRPAQLASSYG